MEMKKVIKEERTWDYIRGLEAYQDSREAAITLGKFDGVHRGHQEGSKKYVS